MKITDEVAGQLGSYVYVYSDPRNGKLFYIGKNREKVDYAMATYQGVVREVYAVAGWYPAESTDYGDRDTFKFGDTGRWEFVGSVTPSEITELYVGR